MKTRSLTAAAIVCGIFSGWPAGATVLTFDDLPASTILSTYGGLTWGQDQFQVLNASSVNPLIANGLVSAPNLAQVQSGAGAISSPASFTLSSLYISSPFMIGASITFQGFNGINLVDSYSTSFSNAATLVTLNWSGIDSVTITSFGGTPDPSATRFADNRFELDDVIINATPIPSALPLFAGGLGLIGLLARSRKRLGHA